MYTFENFKFKVTRAQSVVQYRMQLMSHSGGNNTEYTQHLSHQMFDQGHDVAQFLVCVLTVLLVFLTRQTDREKKRCTKDVHARMIIDAVLISQSNDTHKNDVTAYGDM